MSYICYTYQIKTKKITSTIFYYESNYEAKMGGGIEANQTVTFGDGLIGPEIFESLLFCNSLQYKKSKSHNLENPKFIKFNPGGYTFKFTEDHDVTKKEESNLFCTNTRTRYLFDAHYPPSFDQGK